MDNKKAFSTAAAMALAAGVLLLPAGTFARGAGGFAAGGHGPIFGLRHARIAPHRPIAPGIGRRFPAHFGAKLSWWRFHRFDRRGNDSSGMSAIGDGLYGGYATPYGASDATGSVAPGPGFMPFAPSSYPAEHVGCAARGYDVPSESGGVAKVTVTRC